MIEASIPRFGIPRLQLGEECAVTRGRSRYPLLCGMNSTYKYYGTAFVIFEFHSFDLQASVADDPTVTFRLFRLYTLFLKLGSHYYRELPAPAGGGSTISLTYKTVLSILLSIRSDILSNSPSNYELSSLIFDATLLIGRDRHEKRYLYLQSSGRNADIHIQMDAG
jgi:hypothetical protein